MGPNPGHRKAEWSTSEYRYSSAPAVAFTLEGGGDDRSPASPERPCGGLSYSARPQVVLLREHHMRRRYPEVSLEAAPRRAIHRVNRKRETVLDLGTSLALTMEKGAVKSRAMRLPVHRCTLCSHGALSAGARTRVLGFADTDGRLATAGVRLRVPLVSVAIMA